MASVNKVILVGNLGRDPETRYCRRWRGRQHQHCHHRYLERQGRREARAQEWHRVAFFGKLAEIAGEYSKKVVRYTWKAACAPASGRKKPRSARPPRSWRIACRCSARVAGQSRWGVQNRARQPQNPPAAASLQRKKAAAHRSMTWTTIFRFEIAPLYRRCVIARSGRHIRSGRR